MEHVVHTPRDDNPKVAVCGARINAVPLGATKARLCVQCNMAVNDVGS